MTRNETRPIPARDGIDHLNIYTRGKTRLGRLLTNLSDIPVNHPTYGRFRTMEGLWFYLTTGMKHEDLRALSGFDAKRLGQTLPKVWFEDFQHQFKIGIRCKIEQHEELKSLFIQSTLPFEHYYVYSSKKQGVPDRVIELPVHAWQVEYITQLRDEMKA